MAANGISTLPTKEARQIAKLDLAKAKKIAQGEAGADYDRDLLPAKYVGDVATDTPNAPLQQGRPWI